MNRREMIQLGGAAVVLAPFLQLGCRSAGNVSRLFYDPLAVDSIRANGQSARLIGTLSNWSDAETQSIRDVIERPLKSGDLLSDLSSSMTTIFQQCAVHLVTESEKSAALVTRGLEVLDELPEWDYMRDGGTDVIAVLRASKAIGCVLLCLQVLGDRVDAGWRADLLRAVATKGCVPCDRTIRHMDDPTLAKGWGVEASYLERVPYDMTNWPAILAVNNLRAIPTMGLGLGALALDGIDSRADEWRDLAINSTITYLGLLEKDGSYFEGLSYIDFAFRSLFPFMDANDRLKGDVDWANYVNFRGVLEFITALQNGIRQDGLPDIINISDARDSVFVCVPAWIAKRTGDPLGQFVADRFSVPGFYADFFWYDPDHPSAPPDESLKNKRLDLEWIVARSGWEPNDTVLGFRSGNPSNHEHADRNSMMLKSRGERLLTDPFGAAYNSNDAHWLLRLTESHNAVLVDGRGHQYHNGEQGTNEGEAKAEIVAYNDNGDVIDWASDATHGYKLVNENITSVVRSVCFSKPDVVVLVDRITSVRPSEVTVRFHPDNRDESAELVVDPFNTFEIRRPNATLSCAYASNIPVRANDDTLDLPASVGIFPYVELISSRDADVAIVTAMQIGDPGSAIPPKIVPLGNKRWRVETTGLSVTVDAGVDVTTFDVVD